MSAINYLNSYEKETSLKSQKKQQHKKHQQYRHLERSKQARVNSIYNFTKNENTITEEDNKDTIPELTDHLQKRMKQKPPHCSDLECQRQMHSFHKGRSSSSLPSCSLTASFDFKILHANSFFHEVITF